MKNVKRILAIVLICASLVACVSCGGNKGNGKFPTLTYLYNTSDAHKAIGEYLQAAFATAGVTMQLENQEWNTFLNTRKDGDYSIARNGWVADYTDPICFLDMWTSNSGNNDVQFGKGAHKDLAMYNLDLTKLGYDTKVENGTWAQTYDVLISTIKACTDTNKRYELMHIAEDMLMDTGCIVPLYFYTDLYMIDDSVKGFYSSPLGYKYFMNSTIEGKDNKITVCIASDPDTIDPALNSAVDGATMLAHLFSGLAKWAQKPDGSLYIAPDCVTELVDGVVNADGTVTYTYTLKDGLKWSDGSALKASDFEYAWKRAASTALGADYGYMFEVVKGYGEDDVNGLAPLAVTAKDDKTLEVVLANAVAYWNELLAFPTYFPVKKDVVADESWATKPATYICNGPYTITAWTEGSGLTMTKNPNFHDAASVTMEEIKFMFSDDANTMLANFKNGSWLMIDDVPTAEIPALKTQYPTEFVVAGQIGTYYVCWNVNEEILPSNTELKGVEAEKARQEIRKALGLLIDRNYIVEQITQAGQVPASSFVAMGMTNPDATEFYKTANGGNAKGYYGYYDVSADAFAANCQAAKDVLAKYYDMK